MGTQNFNFSGHLVLVAAERRNNNSHVRKPVDGNFNDFPAPLRGGTEVVPPLFLRLRSIELALRAGLARNANRKPRAHARG